MSGAGAAEDAVIVWFRRDLRVHDHPAVTAALSSRHAVCLFVLDDRLLRGDRVSQNRACFLREWLEALTTEIADQGGVRLVRGGRDTGCPHLLCQRL